MNDNDDDAPETSGAPYPETPAVILPAFAPVPRLCDRSNGWKPEVQRRFIEALAETGSVKAACARVGRADHGAYNLKRHPEGAEFRAAWQAAIDIAMRRLEDTMLDRAINGVEVPVYSYGKLLGTRTKYNDRLGMFMLRNRLPGRYAAGGGPKALNAVGKMEIARLKKQWRAEWEREQLEADHEDEQKVFDELDEFIDTMHQNRWNNMSPRARAAYEEADRINQEDGIDWMAAEPPAEDPDDLAAHERNMRREPGWMRPEAEGKAEKAEEPEEPGAPRVRSPKDEGW